jgi:hypothetical protein
MVSPACSVYGINSFRVINIDRKLLQIARRVFRKAWEGCSGPQGCIDFSITGRILVAMNSMGVSSHDMGSGGGVVSKGCFVCRPSYAGCDIRVVEGLAMVDLASPKSPREITAAASAAKQMKPIWG